MSTQLSSRVSFLAGALLLAIPETLIASSPLDPAGYEEDFDLTDLSLEELMDIEVTIATRTAERMSDVPAAVYVLTGDEIRRAGHSSIPEALRMVPGLHVSRWSSNAWDVTSRGFGPGLSFVSSAYLNQLLVMVDGVVVYTPLFAGMWWPLQDIPMETIDRIEIVRGPGGILWGSNAVHGVIHVITKKADELRGPGVSLRYGTDDQHGTVRYGGKLGEDAHYRAWFKGARYDTLHDPFLGYDYDWGIASAGARFDFKALDRDFTAWTRVYTGEFYSLGADLETWEPIQTRDEKEGAQILASMSDPELNDRWQVWFSSDQQDMKTYMDIHIDELDAEYTRSFETSESNKLNVGGGYRWTQSRLDGYDPYWMTFDPPNYTRHTFRLFALDTLSLTDINTSVTLGLTLEHNSFTDWEFQPTFRTAWSPSDDVMVWGAVSRAVRTPSLEERTLSQDSYFVGDSQFRSEELLAYEVGTRVLPADWVSADLTVYFNDYDSLHYLDPDALPWGYQITNDASGKSSGAELALDFQATEDWKIRSAYTYHYGSYVDRAGDSIGTDQYHPRHVLNVRSYYDLGRHWNVDLGAYLVEDMGPAFKAAEYWRLDARLSWRPSEDFELFVGGQGLNESTRSEFLDGDQVRRAIYVGLSFGS